MNRLLLMLKNSEVLQDALSLKTEGKTYFLSLKLLGDADEGTQLWRSENLMGFSVGARTEGPLFMCPSLNRQ